MKQTIMAIPTNTRLQKDILPILTEALSLEKRSDGPAILRSPFLPKTLIVMARIGDIMNLLKERTIDIGVLADDQAAENQLSGRGKNRDKRMGRRQFGLQLPDAAELRYLIRSEEEGKFKTYYPSYKAEGSETLSFNEYQLAKYGWSARTFGADRCGVTSYPGVMNYLCFSQNSEDQIPQQLQPLSKIVALEGQVEAFMRNGVLPNPVLALDLVRTGETAKRYSLQTWGASLLTALPSVWTSKGSKDSQRNDAVALLREKINQVVPVLDKVTGPMATILES